MTFRDLLGIGFIICCVVFISVGGAYNDGAFSK